MPANQLQLAFFYTELIFNQPIFDFFKKIPGKTIYIFTNDQIYNYLLIDYSQTKTPSKFPSLWLIVASDKLAATSQDPVKQQFAGRIADFVRQIEITAIIQAKPAYILTQNAEYQTSNDQTSFWISHFITKKQPINNYLNYFLQDKIFADFWQGYHFKEQLGNFSVYADHT